MAWSSSLKHGQTTLCELFIDRVIDRWRRVNFAYAQLLRTQKALTSDSAC